jgi:hypothetical protein
VPLRSGGALPPQPGRRGRRLDLWDSPTCGPEKLVIALGPRFSFLREAYGTFSLGFSAGLTGGKVAGRPGR